MLLFPSDFDERVLNRYAKQRKECNWQRFSAALQELANKHYDFTDPHCFKIRPIFESVRVPFGSQAPKPFRPVGYVTSDIAYHSVKELELKQTDKYLLYNLTYFAPVFIWAFLDLRKRILLLMNDIAESQSRIQRCIIYLEKKGQPLPPISAAQTSLLKDEFSYDPNINARILHGTAVVFRQEFWKEIEAYRVEISPSPVKQDAHGWDDYGFEPRKRSNDSGADDGDGRTSKRVKHASVSHTGSYILLSNLECITYSTFLQRSPYGPGERRQ